MKQRKDESLQGYHERYLAQVQVLKEIGVAVVPSTIIEYVAGRNGRSGSASDADKTAANEQYLAACFLQGVNTHHLPYLDHLRNSFLDGQELYPCTLHQAYNILQRRTKPQPHMSLGDGVAFAQGSARGSGKDRIHITCFRCGQQGHYANDCPTQNEQRQEGTDWNGGLWIVHVLPDSDCV
jgi:hypothetical protein